MHFCSVRVSFHLGGTLKLFALSATPFPERTVRNPTPRFLPHEQTICASLTLLPMLVVSTSILTIQMRQEYAPDCVDPTELFSLAAGREFTQPQTWGTIKLCTYIQFLRTFAIILNLPWFQIYWFSHFILRYYACARVMLKHHSQLGQSRNWIFGLEWYWASSKSFSYFEGVGWSFLILTWTTMQYFVSTLLP